MSILIIIAGLVFVVAASAQDTGFPVFKGPVGDLVAPTVSGVPLSVQQVEEYMLTAPDGASRTESKISQIYRDSAGRIRIEWRIPSVHGGSFGVVSLIDPVAHSVAVLQIESKIAERMVVPRSSTGGFPIGLPVVGEWLPSGKWQTRAEGLGTRVIGGVEVEGTRNVQTSDDQPPLLAVQERWFSRSLGLTMVVEGSGPNWKHMAKIQNLDRHEPDPTLFLIPRDFTIRDEPEVR